MNELILRICGTCIIILVCAISFTVGIVGLQKICPDPCNQWCPKTCQMIPDLRVVIPFSVLTGFWLLTIMFIIRGIIVSTSKKYKIGKAESNWLYCTSIYFLVAVGVQMLVSICVIVGFKVSDNSFNYPAMVWLLLSHTVVSGLSIAWCWYPFGQIKKVPINYESVQLPERN